MCGFELSVGCWSVTDRVAPADRSVMKGHKEGQKRASNHHSEGIQHASLDLREKVRSASNLHLVLVALGTFHSVLCDSVKFAHLVLAADAKSHFRVTTKIEEEERTRPPIAPRLSLGSSSACVRGRLG